MPFVGRRAEHASLVVWCTSPEPVGVRLVTGPGGVGKTRLAREFAHHMARAGWTCLSVPDGAEPRALAAVPDGAPALLLVDDADGRGPALAQLLADAARGRNGAVRVLLVARGAGPWFDRLTRADPAAGALLEAGWARADLPAAVLPGQVDARVVAAVAESFADALGLPVPRVSVAAVPGGAPMLDLQAAALCAVLRTQSRGAHGVLPVDVSDALDELLEHERWTWYRSAEQAGLLGDAGFHPEAVDGLVAAATLTGVRTPDAAERLVRRVARVLPGVRPAAAPDVGRWLLDLDPHRSLPARVVDPHLLGELTDAPALLGACLAGAGAPSARRAALRTAGIVADRLDGRTGDLDAALDQLGAAIAALPEDADALRAVSGVLPRPSLTLGELRAEVTLRTLAATGRDSVVGPADVVRRAEALADAGAALAEAGRAGDAEPYQREALVLLHGLDEAEPPGEPGRFRPQLAALLAGLGTTRAAQGRPAEALPCQEEAVRLLRHAAADHPEAVAFDLATALSDLAATRAELGQTLGALGTSQEAVALCRELAGRHPDRCAPALARSLTGLALRLLELGRPDAASAPAREATALLRRPAEAAPDEHLPALGDALHALGTVLAGQGRTEEALRHLEDAVALRRRSAQENPGRYLADLARSLGALGTGLSDAGRWEEGRELQQEAVEVLRRLAAQDPGRHVPELAEALSGLGVTHTRLHRSQEALDAEHEATRTWRDLAHVDPHRYRPRLAESLSNLGAIVAGLKLGDEAVELVREAVALLRELLAENAAKYRPRLVEALRTLALTLHDQERFDEARRARAEAQELGTLAAA
ncbi:tetratricopeptide repeat protein [Promicromonospora sukumoe]|uniref:Tetratricopeptide (TPR) repeat protein n=1 Tax=Promicromonospora sukumoe TaxID=88382 RepID=A0A7W3PES3_9MICO|nr:tetratricopeptide repeat protein [Promicromonospora sukumoe]MBA8808844.1 tetratricopeptide (TPR) repeat protein [Promicromonospora sukumoe]